jgi:hypothetical protein
MRNALQETSAMPTNYLVASLQGCLAIAPGYRVIRRGEVV